MNFELPQLLLICFTYLLCLFGAAYLTERGLLPPKLVRHPLLHALSLGVYASAWTFYGAFGVAAESGLLYLGSYIGAAAAFMLAPVILIPILRITRTYQLSSLADLFAFRFRSGGVGTLTALALLVACLPLLSIQIQAVSDSIYLLNQQVDRAQIAAGFCTIIALFAILFGARRASLRNSHSGLVVAVAIESIIKLLALVTVALFAYFGFFEGHEGLQSWLDANPLALQQMQKPTTPGGWQVLILAFFTSAVVMPHMFHLAFTENVSYESLYKATWVMPLFLLLMALCVPPILWAAHASGGMTTNSEFVVLNLGHTLNQPWLTLVALIGGLSAASGLIIVAVVALASMLQNHLVLPLVRRPEQTRFYTWLLWLRRFLIILLIFACYLFFITFGESFSLQQLGSLGFAAFLQFLPGLLATLYWPGASRRGFLLGLTGGFGIWLFAITLPLHREILQIDIPISSDQHWYLFVLLSVLLNLVLMVIGSLLFPGSSSERQSAEACVLNSLQRPLGLALPAAGQASDLVAQLEPRIGVDSANREVNRARVELNLPLGNLRPIDMLRLRNQLEHNLSGLLGPVEAAAILQPRSAAPSAGFRAREVHLLEQQLEHYDARLSGLAAELDQLRRYHRVTLQRLPIGACTLNEERRIQFWNSELARYTGIDDESCIGLRLISLPPPWDRLLDEFASGDAHHEPAVQVDINGFPRWFSLHKASLGHASAEGMVLLVEDETEYQMISRNLAHQERLASIGRFAAGVAHEIGNPVTGIACLAQNLKLETDTPEVLETGEQIVEQTERISRIVQSLVRFAHTGRQQNSMLRERVSLHECIADAIRLVQLDSRVRQQRFTNSVATDLYSYADPQQMLQVFINLLNNASDASPDQGEIRIDASSEGNRILLSITDEGSGIAPEHIEHLFEPFFTTKEPGKGTGLGLPLVYNIITEHYGSIELFSPADKKQNNGTQVVITLPRYNGSSPD
ncbi:two-component sensor CbrA [Marinobacterium zhoushanense]|uniref:histidine kinase n=1 Tax=Marinobacterium zhoushanense TaxID=1679163 RepID=A0ABQ1KM19_9GAMM|nr:ATP-binding protein [Marinobacterium zhoushanense]GGC00194.1 two-component sensor CbrA [Marinobacterium zhoushanense]